MLSPYISDPLTLHIGNVWETEVVSYHLTNTIRKTTIDPVPTDNTIFMLLGAMVVFVHGIMRLSLIS